ncbi:AT-rich interactive domain-containing protein 4A isoform X2 [Cynoglossus semilaevis]|uniref:AT-rich interactive domain-containing protein 4A isoform X2 n=1 Tax=Cynoglossus semilaevis TaxID=244447 RepID=UPI0007DCB011|nr:AT-rich interactive domain-containing protein 4A isoform X2 [Cynoglossus semilaevis]
MKAADEPAYLTVGTDVSAKYRGAFCEAKIKTVKRMVKVKVTLKGESTSQVVQDDQVKGPLRVGSTVEVKTNEGLSSEGTISKLTDASLYTVVFDDGDEKTLRRTSLCLKGERHFAESETLDQLPLTNPEHFGTPVINKKSNRGRRSSQAVADEENESSSSEDEEDDRRRLNDELLGKVCSIQNESEETSSWFLALVVSPSCNDELVVKKDQCLVRSFNDAKFLTVARRHVHTLSPYTINKPEFSNRRGLDSAQLFLRSKKIPDMWKMDMSQILDSSSSDDEDDEDEKESEEEDEEEEDEEDEKKKKKHIKEEPEEEPDPEERDNFLQQLYKFMEDRGTPINKPPVLGYKDLNLFKLFRLVYHLGGCDKIESGTVWKQVYMDLGIPILNSAASYNVKTAYKKYLYGFEEYCRSASITFRTIHHNNPRPPPNTPPNQKVMGVEPKESSASTPQLKLEPVDNYREPEGELDSGSEKEEVKEHHLSPRGRRRCVVGQGKMERDSFPRSEKRGTATIGENSEEQKDGRRRSHRKMEDSEKGSEDEEDDDDDEEEDDEGDRRRGDSEEEGDGDSVTGTKVRVKYGRGKTQKIYEAHIKKTDMDNGEQFYLVHYYGWNVRYDEWVKADRIIWPVEKGTKKRQRKKVKNKEESEKEEEKLVVKPTGAKRGRPPLKTTPTGPAGRSVSKTPSSEGRSNGKSGRTETTPSMSNGDNTPRRRTRRTSGMYDSDRASNEESGNSGDDSESEDPPDRNLSPWRVRTDALPCQEEMQMQQPLQQHDEIKEEVKKEQEVEEEEDEEEEETTTSGVIQPAAAEDATLAQTSVAPEVPIIPQVNEEQVLGQSQNLEAEQKEEPPAEVPMVAPPPPVEKEIITASPVQEVVVKLSPPAEKVVPVTPPLPITEEDKGTPLSSSRTARGRRVGSGLREMGSETPPRLQLCTSSPSHPGGSPSHPTTLSSPPRSVLKRQDEPMVVLRCLPTEHLPLETPTAYSDTDSASEEGEVSEERSNMALKRKSVEQQRSGDKRFRPERRQEEAASLKTPSPQSKMASSTSPKSLPSPLRPERKSEANTKTEWPCLREEKPSEETEEHLTGAVVKEHQVHAEMPSLAAEAPDSASAEELEPQIGPESLVCHEVDLDDPDEKEKPAPSAEHLLLMMREQAHGPLPLPHLLQTSAPAPQTPHLPQPHVRLLVPAAAPCSTPCNDELHIVRSTTTAAVEEEEEEQQHRAGAEQEGDSSPGFDGSGSSSSMSSSNKDRAQKRVMDCSLSPTTKKHKRSQKRPTTPGKVEKNGAGHSSDSEDQSRLSSLTKSQKPRCPTLVSPSHTKDKHSFPSPQRTYKWTFQLDELENMSSTERISFLQDKLQEIRKYYLTLKSEVASIDRRRKRLKKKEREVSNTTASTSSASSDTGMSPSSASPTQNTVAVECR